MAYVINDEELKQICEQSEHICMHDCCHCDVFWANHRYNNP